MTLVPVWGQYVLGAAAVVTALGVLWTKVFRPGVRAAAVLEDALPVLREVVVLFRGDLNALRVLDAIAAEFRTDSGSSLRDLANRLEAAANTNATAVELLKVGVEASRQLAEQDRAQLLRLVVLLDRLTERVDAGGATGLRIEQAAEGVASDLAAKQAEEGR